MPLLKDYKGLGELYSRDQDAAWWTLSADEWLTMAFRWPSESENMAEHAAKNYERAYNYRQEWGNGKR